jgi:hypothetical protein
MSSRFAARAAVSSSVRSRDDGFLHTLARAAAQRRWPALADALRYSTDGTGLPAAIIRIPAPAETGWHLLRGCWPDLPEPPPLVELAGDLG